MDINKKIILASVVAVLLVGAAAVGALIQKNVSSIDNKEDKRLLAQVEKIRETADCQETYDEYIALCDGVAEHSDSIDTAVETLRRCAADMLDLAKECQRQIGMIDENRYRGVLLREAVKELEGEAENLEAALEDCAEAEKHLNTVLTAYREGSNGQAEMVTDIAPAEEPKKTTETPKPTKAPVKSAAPNNNGGEKKPANNSSNGNTPSGEGNTQPSNDGKPGTVAPATQPNSSGTGGKPGTVAPATQPNSGGTGGKPGTTTPATQPNSGGASGKSEKSNSDGASSKSEKSNGDSATTTG